MKKLSIVPILTALVISIAPDACQVAAQPSTTVTITAAASARESLLGIFQELKRAHHHRPYEVTIDIETGAMTMDNESARWEFNLGDLDVGTISAKTWYPGVGAKEARSIEADCSGAQRCIKWGHSNGLGGYKAPPQMWRTLSFQVYKGEGANYERDEEAENLATEAVATLIAYFRDTKN